jgi:hypothetical protein
MDVKPTTIYETYMWVLQWMEKLAIIYKTYMWVLQWM